ncbi:TIM-barrel fold metal-dependent hydrolase [Candidatus Omnitrophus magneticus]|uniref:TIM-barrel fold metal-dependent hydrolase n=1 Tax=Candidatus Omnitrophus magneticus TaxID=1609969 RepID=A0A0F0CWQ7_9BACT|nr:TIM-barrel fold metal-dependent hydrolase [Candidatus Omnitrophus magneticus]
MNNETTPDIILHNGKITALENNQKEEQSLAIKNGKITKTGSNNEILKLAGQKTITINLNNRRVIPGLNDSHLHVIRAGLYYNLELRWDGVSSVSEALYMLKEQAKRTPPPQWVRVIGGWNEWGFREKRMPTLDEINSAAPDTPVFILHLYDCALLNRAALRALGMDKNTPNPPGGLIARDASGIPTGLFIAEPNALILYSTISMAPKLSFDDQLNSSRHFMRELNRFGVTSVSDAGGGGQNYPEDYAVIQKLANENQLTVRIAYSLFAQKPGKEIDDYKRWISMTKPDEGDMFLKMNGAGENLAWSAADFENFLQVRPDLKPFMEEELECIVRELVKNRWPFRIHATYEETIKRFLNIFERVNKDIPFDKLRWWLDHAETISNESIERVASLNGGIAVQHRMAYQGEYFIRRYGQKSAESLPPIKNILKAGIPVGLGTDGTRVASYHPWTCLWWLVTGKTVGHTIITPTENRMTRKDALMLYTNGSAWFSGEQENKGLLKQGHLADISVLSDDYFNIPEDKIRNIESLLTIVNGKIVYGSKEYSQYCPPLPKASPDWSPIGRWGGYHQETNCSHCHEHTTCSPLHHHNPIMGADGRLWNAGCDCAVF